MQENEEVYADSGEPLPAPRKISRGTALKVGGLGLAGALVGFMPGRAAAMRRKQQAVLCNGNTGGSICGQVPIKCDFNSSCACFTVFYKVKKVGAPKSLCGSFYFSCGLSRTCLRGQGGPPGPPSDPEVCPPGYFCATPQSTCCSKPVCVPLCQSV